MKNLLYIEDSTAALINVIGILILVVGGCLIIRPLLLWYWKVNERIKLMRLQNTLLMALVAKMGISEDTLNAILKANNENGSISIKELYK